LIAAYLVGVNLLLNTPLGPGLVNLRPHSARLDWGSAWTLWPGHLSVRKLEIHGQARSRAWSVSIDRASGRWSPLSLFARHLDFSEVQAEGVATRIRRVPYTPPPGTKSSGTPIGPPLPGRLRTWRFSFDVAKAEKVGVIDLFGLVIDCAGGEASGRFSFQLAGDRAVEGARGHCSGAALRAGGREIARGLEIEATADIAPYSPRQHPGVEGFDFLSGTLKARGTADIASLMARAGDAALDAAAPALAKQAEAVVDLKIAEGAFSPGSLVRVGSTGAAQVLELSVGGEPASMQVHLSAPSLHIAAPGDASHAAIESGPIDFAGSTPERRVSRLFSVTRTLKSEGRLEGIGLRGSLTAAEPRVDFETPRLALKASASRLTGTVDLAALLEQQLWVEGLVVEGLSASWIVPPDAPASEAKSEWPWAMALYDARFPGVKELVVNRERFSGPFDVALSAGLSPAEGFEVGSLQVAAPKLVIDSGERAVSRDAKLDLYLKIAPVLFGLTSGKEALATTSGRLRLSGRFESIGMLGRFLARVPWLRVEGGGDLDADVSVRDGRLLPGSRLRVGRGRFQARILHSLARGQATLAATVTAATPPRASIDVVFPSYEMADAEGEAAYLRGRGLRIEMGSGELDLTKVVEDLKARVTAKGAEIPDLTVYNAYLPAGAGLSVRGGHGNLDLRLDLDQSAGTSNGALELSSPDAVIEFADVLLEGKLAVASKMHSGDLEKHRFDVSGTELRLEEVSFHEIGGEASPDNEGWWARLTLASGEVDWQRPMTLDARADVRMKDSGFLLSLASRRKRFLSWFKGVLDEQDVVATAQVKVGGGSIVIDPLRAEGGKLEVRARMRLAKARRRIDLFVRHGHLAAGLELRDGARDIKLLRPEAWYDSRAGFD
jgi:autotransporter translocation and assembly factor TamB